MVNNLYGIKFFLISIVLISVFACSTSSEVSDIPIETTPEAVGRDITGNIGTGGKTVADSKVITSTATPVSKQTEKVENVSREQKKTGPKIEIGCPNRLNMSQELRCSFKYSGNVERVKWTTSGGMPSESNANQFIVKFNKPGVFTVTLEACNRDACTTAVHKVEIIEEISETKTTEKSTHSPTPTKIASPVVKQAEKSTHIPTPTRIATPDSNLIKKSTHSPTPTPTATLVSKQTEKVENVSREQKKTGPKIEIGCPTRLNLSQELRCAFRHSGNLERVKWTVPGGIPSQSNESKFIAKFNQPGVFIVTLEACNKDICTTVEHKVEIIEEKEEKKQTIKSSKPTQESVSTDKNSGEDKNVNEKVKRDKLNGVYPCVEDGTKEFTSFLFPPNLITGILPMGKMAGSHVTPTDHLYILRNPPIGEDTEYVVAPADGQIVKIQRFPQDQIAGWNSSIKIPDYRVVIMHSCTFFTIFIHLGEFAPAIAEQIGDMPLNSMWFSTKSKPIELKAGDPIAKHGNTSFDWSVHDADIVLPGFVVKDHYDGEPWKIHTVDPFQFYKEPLKSELLSKAIRKIEPREGKIDYDVEGTILGNWFLDGTISYHGNSDPGGKYWNGHLAIAYGYIDPTQIRISIGLDTAIDDDSDCNVCFGAYGVRGNTPDPAKVDSTSGIVKYELMSRQGPNHEQVGNTSLGTFLVQHLGDRTIKVEILAGVSPDQVSGFSDRALIYRR